MVSSMCNVPNKATYANQAASPGQQYGGWQDDQTEMRIIDSLSEQTCEALINMSHVLIGLLQESKPNPIMLLVWGMAETRMKVREPTADNEKHVHVH